MSDSVFEMNGLRVVDLSKPLDPATETRRLRLRRFNTGGPIPDFHTDMDITSHLGTHVECPYHHREDWPSVAEVPLTQFMGRGVYINFTELPPNAYLTAEALDRYAAPKIREGDVVIIDSPYRIPPFTALTNGPEDKRLFVNGETAEWFLAHKVKCVGFGEGVSIENRNEDVCPFHDILLEKNILFIEVLQNLDKLTRDTFFISYAPMNVKGLDSCSVRCYAIEGLAEFQ